MSLEYSKLRYIDDIDENIKPMLIDQYESRRYQAFLDGVDWIEYEMVPGDFLEFGVASGITSLFISLAYQRYKQVKYASKGERKLYSFDSFEGLPENDHPRWPKEMFKNNLVAEHPTLGVGEQVQETKILEMFDKCQVEPKPTLIKGYFNETLPKFVATSDCKVAALIHVDCDIYHSAKDVLNSIKPLLQNGTLIYFDDWNNYKGSSKHGERRAVKEFLEENPDIKFEEFLIYTAFSRAFIVQIGEPKVPLTPQGTCGSFDLP